MASLQKVRVRGHTYWRIVESRRVNGKPRADMQVAADIDKDTAIEAALASEAAQRYLDGNTPKKVIFIPGRGGQEPKVNIVV